MMELSLELHGKDVPEDWLCPECGVGKEDFDMIEIT